MPPSWRDPLYKIAQIVAPHARIVPIARRGLRRAFVQGFIESSGSVEPLRALVKASCDRLFTPGTPSRVSR